MGKEIMKADRAYRRKLFLAYGLCVLAGAATVLLGLPLIRQWLGGMPGLQAYRMMEPLLIGLIVSFSPAAAYIIIVGRRILRHDAVPYPGMKVIRDTVILRGVNARWRGRALIVLGSLFLVLMTSGSVMLHWSFGWFLRVLTGE